MVEQNAEKVTNALQDLKINGKDKPAEEVAPVAGKQVKPSSLRRTNEATTNPVFQRQKRK